MAPQLKGIPISPLTGEMDTRSLLDEIPPTALRLRQNFRVPDGGKICRAGGGFEKLLNGPGYNNQDLHDQITRLTGERQPIIFVKEIESSRKVRYLFAGTQSTIYRLNEWTGNWMVVGTGLGSTSLSANDYRWHACVLGDYAVFTNNFSNVLYMALEQSPTAAPLAPLLNPIADLADPDIVGLTRAAGCFEWRNMVFLFDLEMGGDRVPYRLMWSDYNNPTSFDPSLQSTITGTQDLYLHEQILGAAPAGNNMLIYTTHGIWEMSVVAQAGQPFAFRRVYSADGKDGTDERIACLAYPNTLVSMGDAHLYMGVGNKIYIYSQYYQKPTPLEWIHKASGTLFQNLDQGACNAHCGVYSNFEVYFSVAKKGDVNQCPSQTLRLQMQYKAGDYLDYGVTAFTTYRAGQVQTIRDWLIDNGLCTVQGLTDQGYGYVNEGLPNPIPTASAPFTPTCIYTTKTKTVGAFTIEDYTQPQADPHSLCALLGGLRFDDICLKCQPTNTLVMASSADWCLKQINNTLYRERCTNPKSAGTNGPLGYVSSMPTYILDGYDSIVRFGPIWGNEVAVVMNYFKVNYLADAQNPPSQLQVRIGISAQVGDPNTDQGGIIWFPLTPKNLTTLALETPAQQAADNTIPMIDLHWNFHREGRFVYVEMKISGTGGGSCFSGVEARAGTKRVKNF